MKQSDQTDKEQLWFSQIEMKACQRRDQYIVEMLDQGIAIDESESHCTRGLEYKTRDGKRRRGLRRRAARKTVLKEQADQMQRKGCVDSVALAQIYHDLSMQSERDARMLGLKDARYVQVCVAETAVFSKPVCSQRPTKTVLSKSGQTHSQPIVQALCLRVAGIAA
jgi:hypothetical protein